jgi:hypothetical protein
LFDNNIVLKIDAKIKLLQVDFEKIVILGGERFLLTSPPVLLSRRRVGSGWSNF